MTAHSVTDDLAAAYAARHEGQAATTASDVAAHRGHGDFIRTALTSWIESGSTFTSDDVRVLAADLAISAGHDFRPAPNLLPAYIGGAAQGPSPRIVEVGRVASRRPSRRGSKVSVYAAPNPAARATPAAPGGARKPAVASPTGTG